MMCKIDFVKLLLYIDIVIRKLLNMAVVLWKVVAIKNSTSCLFTKISTHGF